MLGLNRQFTLNDMKDATEKLLAEEAEVEVLSKKIVDTKVLMSLTERTIIGLVKKLHAETLQEEKDQQHKDLSKSYETRVKSSKSSSVQASPTAMLSSCADKVTRTPDTAQKRVQASLDKNLTKQQVPKKKPISDERKMQIRAEIQKKRAGEMTEQPVVPSSLGLLDKPIPSIIVNEPKLTDTTLSGGGETIKRLETDRKRRQTFPPPPPPKKEEQVEIDTLIKTFEDEQPSTRTIDPDVILVKVEEEPVTFEDKVQKIKESQELLMSLLGFKKLTFDEVENELLKNGYSKEVSTKTINTLMESNRIKMSLDDKYMLNEKFEYKQTLKGAGIVTEESLRAAKRDLIFVLHDSPEHRMSYVNLGRRLSEREGARHNINTIEKAKEQLFYDKRIILEDGYIRLSDTLPQELQVTAPQRSVDTKSDWFLSLSKIEKEIVSHLAQVGPLPEETVLVHFSQNVPEPTIESEIKNALSYLHRINVIENKTVMNSLPMITLSPLI